MSYDIYLKRAPCEACKRPAETDFDMNPTYNLTPIFDLALTGEPLPNPDTSEAAVVLFRAPTDRPRGLRVLSGRKAEDTIPWLRKALGHVKDPAREAEFRALEPDNKWGTLEDARYVFAELLQAAEVHPSDVWDVR